MTIMSAADGIALIPGAVGATGVVKKMFVTLWIYQYLAPDQTNYCRREKQ